jgi:predicted HTH domain antitoxin
VTFPNTAVLYLRTYKKTPDKMRYVMITPGGTVQYDIPIMKVQTYSLDDIFEKGLLLLIPFYIFSHEKGFPEYNSNEQKLAELQAEYQDMYENVQKGIGEIMGGALIETEARTILNQGRTEMKREMACKLIKNGKLSIEEIAECSGLKLEEVEELANLQLA